MMFERITESRSSQKICKGRGVLLLLIFLSHFSTASCVSVTYLRGVPRLSNTSFWDYYFLCHTVGRALIWNVNGLSLNGFLSSDVPGEVVPGRTVNFTYTANLLLLEPVDVQFSFYSILIVSQAGNFLLDITCSNGPSSSRTSNTGNVSNIADGKSMNSVFEQYLLSTDQVGENITYTSIFICGVQNTFMYWRAGNSTHVIGFSAHDNVGQERRIIEPGTTYVNQQGIIIGHKPYLIVSVFFITNTSNVTVACGDNQNEVNLTTNYSDGSYHSGTTPQTTNSDFSSSSTLLSFSTSVENITESELSIIHEVIIAIVIILVIVSVLVALVVMITCILYKRAVRKRVSNQGTELTARNYSLASNQETELTARNYSLVSNQGTELTARNYSLVEQEPPPETDDDHKVSEQEWEPETDESSTLIPSNLFYPSMSSSGERERKTFKSSSNDETTPEPVDESRFPISHEEEPRIIPFISTLGWEPPATDDKLDKRMEWELPATDDKPDNEQEWEPEMDESSALIPSYFFDPKGGERHQWKSSKRSLNARTHETPRSSWKSEGNILKSSFTCL